VLIQARVLRQAKDGIIVAICRDCGSCKICKPAPEKLLIKTKKKHKKGELINIQLNSAYFWRALGLLILLPLITLLIVLPVLLRCGLSEIQAASGALALCLAEYVLIYFYDRTIKTADLYAIISRR
jgi:positive regulator of sigma E activity